MMEFLSVMTVPLAACIVLTGMHAYLGLHVIDRQIIFVDLALAQIAALGAGVALLTGHDGHDASSYAVSRAFTIGGAALLALTRSRKTQVPQEALIGIVYAVSAAALVMVLSRSGEGDEHIRQMLVGNILLTGSEEVAKMFWIYLAVGVAHYICRNQLFLISRDPDKASQNGLGLKRWDFVFYATFGVVVTCSVHVAGVLLVFAFLVVPATCAILFVKSTKARLLFGWALGALASLIGMGVSYFLDFPTGASVVCVFGVLMAICLCARNFSFRM